MERHIFGKAEAKVNIITMGKCGLGSVDQDKVDKAIKLAMDNIVNMIEVAPIYGNSKIHLILWIPKYRNHFYFLDKTLKRSKKKAWKQLKKSLDHLRAIFIYFYKFNAFSSIEELEQILGKGGVVVMFKEVREIRLIKNIGIT